MSNTLWNKLSSTPEDWVNKNDLENTSSINSSSPENIIKKETSEQIKENIAETPVQKANKAAQILSEYFWTDYNLVKAEWFRIYHIARKDIVIQLKWRPIVPVEGKIVLGEGQVRVNVNPDGSLNIRLNSDKWNVRYQAENLSNDDLIKKLPALKSFIENWTYSFDKQIYVWKNTSDYSSADIDDILRGYEEDPKWSKPQ